MLSVATCEFTFDLFLLFPTMHHWRGFYSRWGHSADPLVRMLVRKYVEKGSKFGPVKLTMSLEKGVLFRVTFTV